MHRTDGEDHRVRHGTVICYKQNTGDREVTQINGLYNEQNNGEPWS